MRVSDGEVTAARVFFNENASKEWPPCDCVYVGYYEGTDVCDDCADMVAVYREWVRQDEELSKSQSELDRRRAELDHWRAMAKRGLAEWRAARSTLVGRR